MSVRVHAVMCGPRAALAASICLPALLIAGCAGSPHLYASVHHHAIDLGVGSLEEGGLAFVTPSVADVHFEKAVRSQPGATQAIRVGVARALAAKPRVMLPQKSEF